MNWIKFIIWLCGLYAVYYLAIVLWDVWKSGSPVLKTGANELTFSEDIVPVSAFAESEENPYESPVVSSGGVSLKQLFNLAREEAIEFIRPVSFL